MALWEGRHPCGQTNVSKNITFPQPYPRMIILKQVLQFTQLLLILQQKQNGYTVTTKYKFGSYQFTHDQKWFCFDAVKSAPYVETNYGYLLNALYLTHAIFNQLTDIFFCEDTKSIFPY